MKRVIAPLLAFMVAGCASVPHQSVRYFYPKAAVPIQVVESVACNKDKNVLVAIAALAPITPVYSADLRGPAEAISFSSVSGPLADGDMTVGLTDDGRLQSINATATGTGDAIVKNIVSLAAAGAGVMTAKGFEGGDDVSNACALIVAYGGDKAVSLTFSNIVVFDQRETPVPAEVNLDPDPSTEALYRALTSSGFVTRFHAKVAVQADSPSVQPDPGVTNEGMNLLRLNTVTTASIEVSGVIAKATDKPLWRAEVPVPSRGRYSVPIPHAPAFGKQTFAITLSPFGSIQKLQYAGTSGTADALDAGTALAKAAAGPSAADQAAALKAQADLIAQQQRLAQCLATPTSCKT